MRSDAYLRAQFARFVELNLGFRPPKRSLDAALLAVRFRATQASSKLSPVIKVPRGVGKKPSVKEVAPYASSIYASFETCPTTCAFLRDPDTGERRGCYVTGNVNQTRTTNDLDKHARQIPEAYRGELIALTERWLMATTFAPVPNDGHLGRGRDLRLHVSGDAVGPELVDHLADGAMEWEVWGGGDVWTFTHAWRETLRSRWSNISALASVETGADILRAREQGYAAAIVVPAFPRGKKPFTLKDAPGTKVLPCPNEAGVISPRTGAPITCIECRMCLDDRRLFEKNHAIAFKAHGSDKGAAIVSLDRLRQKPGGDAPPGGGKS